MVSRAIEGAVMDNDQVFGLAQRTPIFVINGQVHYCFGNSRSGPNTFKFHSDRVRPVKEGPSLRVLEKLRDIKLSESYAIYQDIFIKEEFKRSGLTNLGGDNNLVRFVLRNVFPYLRHDDEGMLASVFNTKAKSKKVSKQSKSGKAVRDYDKKVADYFEGRVKYFENERSRYKPIVPTKSSRSRNRMKEKSLDAILLPVSVRKGIDLGGEPEVDRRDSVLYSLTNGQDFAIIDRSLYFLRKMPLGGELNVDGRGYILENAIESRKLFLEFSKRKANELSLDALRHKFAENAEYQKLRTKEIDIAKYAGVNTYHEGEFGFEKAADNKLLLYAKIPDYVLKSPGREAYYRFKGHKIALRLKWNSGYKNAGLDRGPHKLSHVVGPFYDGSGSSGLCMGHYNHDYFDRMDRGKAIAKYLLDARNVILHGYQKGSNPYRSLSDSNFEDRRISLREIKKKKLPITNINYQRGRRR
ncbi:hypothetical protein GOV14_02430 [Candidatus Pacearchaeota archaeon]|nr:hypothetical protein [Candidatus Pacearchaeota archaeon]